MNNNTTETTNPYARQRGFFGSVKDLGTTSIKGTGLVVNDAITITTDITGSTATITGVARSAISIWGNNLLADLESDAQIDGIHREIQQLHQANELTALKAELSKAKNNKAINKSTRTTNA